MYQLDQEAFGAFLQAQRREKGFTQRQLAERLHVSDKAVSKWERGLSSPDIALLIPLAEQLDVTVTVAGHSNHWRVFVFAPAAAPQARVVTTPEELEEICRTGGCALVTRTCFEKQIPCNFVPVFWSPVFFPSRAFPKGESSEMAPFMGSASWEPTIL